MSSLVTKYSVFIASPEDVQDERRTVINAIHKWNSIHSNESGIMLQPLTWENDTIPDFSDSPQVIINKQLLGQPDLLIAILWSRLGTPTKNYQSGTLEEIARFSGHKMVYFCDRSRTSKPGTLEAEQAAKVDEFRLSNKHTSYTWNYTSVSDFSDKVQAHISTWANKLHPIPKKTEPTALISYDIEKQPSNLLAEWCRSGKQGTVQIYNAELNTFKDLSRYLQVWGQLSELPQIKKVSLLLPRYKLNRLREFVLPYKNFASNLNRFHICEMKTRDFHSDEKLTNIGFAMFVADADHATGNPNPLIHLFVLSPPFSTAAPDIPKLLPKMWNYRFALELRSHPGLTNTLTQMWHNNFEPDNETALNDYLIVDENTIITEEAEEVIIETSQSGGPSLFDIFYLGHRIRSNLFDQNIPTYVLDNNFFILDWNITFEMLFPTDKFSRGDYVTKFLNCLDNSEEIINNASSFGHPKPSFHFETFYYGSSELDPPAQEPRSQYGLIKFTKITSPTWGPNQKIMGWNVALNIDSIEKKEKFNADRKERIALENVLTHYAGPYEHITATFPTYTELAKLHIEAVRDADNILDLGCGPGVLTEMLLEMGKTVTAVDHNDAMLNRLIKRCRAWIEIGKLRIVKADIEDLNGFQREFDGAVMLNVLYSVNDKKRCLKRLHELLLDNAKVAISGPRVDANVGQLCAEIIRKTPRRATQSKQIQWENDLETFRETNEKFISMNILHSLPLEALKNMLQESGFEIEETKPRVYASQGQYVTAKHIPN